MKAKVHALPVRATRRPMAKKNKKSALSSAASKKLERIGVPKVTPEEFAHYMLHAEERGEATRVPLEEGGWVWKVTVEGKERTLTPTPEVITIFERMLKEGHPAHD